MGKICEKRLGKRILTECINHTDNWQLLPATATCHLSVFLSLSLSLSVSLSFAAAFTPSEQIGPLGKFSSAAN